MSWSFCHITCTLSAGCSLLGVSVDGTACVVQVVVKVQLEDDDHGLLGAGEEPGEHVVDPLLRLIVPDVALLRGGHGNVHHRLPHVLLPVGHSVEVDRRLEVRSAL